MLGKEDLMKMERPRSKEDREEKKTRLSAQDGVNAVLLQVDNPTRLIFCDDRRVSQNNYKCWEGNAVLLQDVLNSISSPTVVLKMDIEGYECKVNSLQWWTNYCGLFCRLCRIQLFSEISNGWLMWWTYPRLFCRLCKYQFFLVKAESSFLSSFWSGTRLSGASTISMLRSPFISRMFKIVANIYHSDSLFAFSQGFD